MTAQPALSPELSALLRLLDDTDERIAHAVEEKILTYGEIALAALEPYVKADDTVIRDRVSCLIAKIASARFLAEIRVLHDESETLPDGDIDLEFGVGSLARFAYPFYEQYELEETLASFARRLQTRISLCSTHGEVLKAFIYFFTCEEMFAGNTDDYYNPDNSYINKVLELRRGIPISLSVVWLMAARRLNLPLTGVNLPGHFMLKYDVPKADVYIDPFSGGKILSRLDCVKFMTNAGYQFSEKHLAPTTNRQILIRMLNNLIEIYFQRSDRLRAEPLKRAIEILI